MDFRLITDYNAVCAAIKEDANALPTVSHLPELEGKDVINSFMYKRMVRAMNIQEDGTIWEPNYNDGNEVKIEPWLGIEADDERPGGFGFSSSDYDHGVRLRLPAPAVASRVWRGSVTLSNTSLICFSTST